MATNTIEQVTNNSENNYCKMPDGTLIQWGFVGEYTAAAETTYIVTLPLPYIDWSYAVIANGQFNTSDTVNYDVTVTTAVTRVNEITMHVRNPTRTYVRPIYWMTIGRWK